MTGRQWLTLIVLVAWIAGVVLFKINPGLSAFADKKNLVEIVGRGHKAVFTRKEGTKVPSQTEDASAQEAAELADSVANEDDEEGDPSAATSADAIARFPYRPYCRECGRDTVTRYSSSMIAGSGVFAFSSVSIRPVGAAIFLLRKSPLSRCSAWAMFG